MIQSIKAKIKLYVSLLVGKKNYKWVLSDWTKLRDLDAIIKVLSTERFSRNLKTILVKPNNKWKNALFLTPHQDDETIGAGGMMSLLNRQGTKLNCLYITSGSKSHDASDKLKKVRREEAENVWNEFGGDVTFFDYTDGSTPLNDKAAQRLAKFINEKKSDVVFLPFLLDDHNEHRRVNHLFYLAQKYIIKNNFEVWAYPVWGSIIPNVAVDISKVLNEKIRINSFWKSQNTDRDYSHLSLGMSIYNTKFVTIKPLPKYVEVFFSVPFVEYMHLCKLYYSEDMNDIYYDYDEWRSNEK